MVRPFQGRNPPQASGALPPAIKYVPFRDKNPRPDHGPLTTDKQPIYRSMTMPKTDKELAFLHDLFVATDWGERFAQLIDEHVKLPKQGLALYVGSGTGGHAIALQERGGALKFLGIDESPDYLELAQAKATAVNYIGVQSLT